MSLGHCFPRISRANQWRNKKKKRGRKRKKETREKERKKGEEGREGENKESAGCSRGGREKTRLFKTEYAWMVNEQGEVGGWSKREAKVSDTVCSGSCARGCLRRTVWPVFTNRPFFSRSSPRSRMARRSRTHETFPRARWRTINTITRRVECASSVASTLTKEGNGVAV